MYTGIVVGCGKIGVQFEANENRLRPRSHAGALTENARTKLVAFVGESEVEHASVTEFFPNVPFYSDLLECIEKEKPDIAIIAASTPVHASLAITCAERGVPIVIGEKPIASDMQGALAIESAVKKNGTTFALNYQRRYFPLFKKTRERIQRCDLGRVREVRCLYDNGLFNNGGHAIDSVLFLLGEKMVSATGIVVSAITTHPQNDPNIEATVQTNAGTQITLKPFDQKISPIHELQFVGEKGDLHIRDYGYAFEWAMHGVTPITNIEREELSMTAGVLNDAIDAHEEKRPPQSGIHNGIETLAVLEAVFSSVRRGGAPMEVAYNTLV